MPKLYKVGGCVRDALLNVRTKDIDFTFVLDNINQTVEEGFKEMETWMLDRGYKIHLSTPEMFTIRGKFPKGHKFEGLDADLVLARKEVGYIENTRNPILELGTLEDDLLRRDFTLNAMAFDENDELIDLFNGVEDLSNKILRTPLPAHKTMLDDPLRFLRALRFSITKGMDIHEDIFNALISQPEILDKLDKVVSSDRMREELNKMFVHDTLKSFNLLNEVESKIPNFIELLFKKERGLFLKPTLIK